MEKVMFDYVKMTTKQIGLITNLLSNPFLDFKSRFNHSTAEVETDVKTAEYKNLRFKVYQSGRVEIDGSLHKYWNDGIHNYDDYNLEAVRNTIKDLQCKFKIDPFLARLNNLEVGLNIILPFSPKIALNGIIAYNNYPFSYINVKGKRIGKDVCLQQYRIKVYNKGFQYHRDENLLRFERKYNRMINLRIGQTLLGNLGEFDFANHCIDELLLTFENIIITEKVTKSILTKPEVRIYDLCNNPLSWETMTSKQRLKYKPKFAEIIDLHGQRRIRETLITALEKKKNELLIL